jgi:hypothetical protein
MNLLIIQCSPPCCYCLSYKLSLLHFVEFEVLIAVTMKSTVYWVLKPCCSERSNFSPCSCWFLALITLRPCRSGDYLPPKRRVISEHDVSTQRTILFPCTLLRNVLYLCYSINVRDLVSIPYEPAIIVLFFLIIRCLDWRGDLKASRCKSWEEFPGSFPMNFF